MAKTKENQPKRRLPSQTLEAREDRLISLAMDQAEKQMREGTASSQIITHYLKLGSTKEKLEREMMEEQKKLLIAKTEAIESQKKVEELYAEALTAMKSYSGQEDPNEEIVEDEDY